MSMQCRRSIKRRRQDILDPSLNHAVGLHVLANASMQSTINLECLGTGCCSVRGWHVMNIGVLHLFVNTIFYYFLLLSCAGFLAGLALLASVQVLGSGHYPGIRDSSGRRLDGFRCLATERRRQGERG